ncbi:unnamed protein product [Ceratitis capitata]|uniref:(Mediterranean fruit fly) hypothetical protein n=1 Tax=Ceratitis capitata TaxID=7213 RepID=A0A811UMH5_CERCA|nr:unnamed protein product [Ceratitis capitata]
MGAIPSKKLHCDLECFAPIQGRYTQIHEERTTCNAVGTQNVKVLSKSCENSSALHKLTKLDASESSTKDSSRKFRQPQKGHRNLTLHMIIRRRPSYRKALREPNCISNFVQNGTPEDYKSVQREKAMDTRVNCTANERENICENVNMQIEHFEEKGETNIKIISALFLTT